MTIFPVSACAGGLPDIEGSPIHGSFFVCSERAFDFVVFYDGKGMLFLKKKRSKDYVGQDYMINVYTLVEHTDDTGKVTQKRFDQESFSAEVTPENGQTEQSYTAEVTGGAKVKISMKYLDGKMMFYGEVLERGELKDGKLAVVFRVTVPQMYTDTYESADKKKLRDKMRGDSFKLTRAADGKTLSLRSYEVADLASEEIAGAGFTKLVSEMGAQEDKELTFTSVSGKEPLEISSKSDKENMIWKGYTVRWRSSEEEKAASAFVIQVK